MANSEGRAGGMNFHPKQLQKEWKPQEKPNASRIREDKRPLFGTQKSEDRQGNVFEGREEARRDDLELDS